MKKLILLLTILTASLTTFAQKKDSTTFRKNIIYAEGSTFSAFEVWFASSINYERIFLQKKKLNFSCRWGAGGWQAFGPGGFQGLTGLSMFTGRKSHHLEVQAGANVFYYYYKSSYDFNIHPYIQAGYRYQKPGGRFMAKAHIGTYGLLNIAIGTAF